MYHQASSDVPSGYSGSAFRSETNENCFPEADIRPSAPEKRSPLRSILDRFRIGRYLKDGFDLEDLLILALALLLLLEDGEGDLFPLLLLFLLFQ